MDWHIHIILRSPWSYCAALRDQILHQPPGPSDFPWLERRAVVRVEAGLCVLLLERLRSKWLKPYLLELRFAAATGDK